MTTQSNYNTNDGGKLDFWYLFVLFLLVILVYFPLGGTGFTTNDDLMISNKLREDYSNNVSI